MQLLILQLLTNTYSAITYNATTYNANILYNDNCNYLHRSMQLSKHRMRSLGPFLQLLSTCFCSPTAGCNFSYKWFGFVCVFQSTFLFVFVFVEWCKSYFNLPCICNYICPIVKQYFNQSLHLYWLNYANIPTTYVNQFFLQHQSILLLALLHQASVVRIPSQVSDLWRFEIIWSLEIISCIFTFLHSVLSNDSFTKPLKSRHLWTFEMINYICLTFLQCVCFRMIPSPGLKKVL